VFINIRHAGKMLMGSKFYDIVLPLFYFEPSLYLFFLENRYNSILDLCEVLC
jgi:hypothetical protein